MARYSDHVEEDSGLVLAAFRAAPRPWDKQGNLRRLEDLTRKAVALGARLVVTPEGFLEGYLWNDEDPQQFSPEQYLEVGETVDGPIIGQLRALTLELGIYLAIGFAERRGDQMYNSMIILDPDGADALVYAKTHTAGDEPFNTKGSEFPVVDTPFGRWGVLICMDRQLPETSRVLALEGAQLILVPAWGMCGEMNDAMMRTRAFENGVHVAFVHPRRCLIVGPDGTILREDQGYPDEIVMALLELRPSGLGSPIVRRRPEIYQALWPSE